MNTDVARALSTAGGKVEGDRLGTTALRVLDG